MADERRILLVEDDVLIGMMLVDMLDTLGYPEPAQAAAIDEALAIVDVGPVAAALIDINLGETKGWPVADRSEEHTSELQSLMRISYAGFCLIKKTPHSRTDAPNAPLNSLIHHHR